MPPNYHELEIAADDIELRAFLGRLYLTMIITLLIAALLRRYLRQMVIDASDEAWPRHRATATNTVDITRAGIAEQLLRGAH